MKKLRLAIACSSICTSHGGTERAAVNLAKAMAESGHHPLLLSIPLPQNKNPVPCYPLAPGVRHLVFDGKGRHSDIKRLRDFLVADKTDVFLSMQSDRAHLHWSMVCMGSGIPFICSERVDPVIYIENMAWNKRGRHAVLAGADCIHELAQTYIESIPEIFRNKVRIIPNAAPQNAILADPVGGERKKLLYLARLCGQKRPILLVESFKLIANKHPDWDLIMWGHGEDEKKLRKYINRNGLERRVEFRGLCKDSPKAFAEAQLYCLPSWFEGFPNTVLEAMSAGLPVAGFANCKGVEGVVKDSQTGMLAKKDTPQSLAEVLDKLMSDASLRVKMGSFARSACHEYSPEKIFSRWETLFYELAQKKGNTVMDSFYQEPFSSKARLSAAARREWLYRNFGEPMPHSLVWLKERGVNLSRNLWQIFKKKFGRKDICAE